MLRPPLLIVLVLGLLTAPAATASAPPRGCNGDPSLCDRRLDEVALPSTHNAMSARALGWLLPNQPVGIPDQLAAGVRGFLIDTYYGHLQADGKVVTDPAPTPGGDMYVCHVSCYLGATPLRDVLRAMRDHLRAHPRNVMVVVNEDHVAPRDFARAVRTSGLIRHVYRGRPGPRWPTLRRMIQRHGQVVMLAEGDAGDVRWYHEAYDGIVQETPYTWPTPPELTDPARWEASCRPNRGGTMGSLLLLNHWSPPLAPDPATSASVNAADVIAGRAATCRRVRGTTPNLIAVDMFTSGGLFEGVARVNAAAPSAR